MRISLSRLGFALQALCVVSLQAPALAKEGLELCQKTAAGGEYIVDVTSTALKIAKRGTPIFLIAKAPNWSVNLYNTETKKTFTTSIDRFQGSFANSFFKLRGDDPNSLVWKDTGTENYKGIQAVHLVTKREDTEKTTGHYSTKEWQGSVRGDVYLAKAFPVPPAVPSIICKYYGIPRFNGLPLDLTHNKANQNASVGLRTLWIKKPSLTDKDFDEPKGFAKAKTEQETVYNADENPFF